MDDLHSEPRVLRELTRNKMEEDAESDLAIRFVDENEYRDISAEVAKQKNLPSFDVDSNDSESSSEEDEEVSANEEEAVTETDSE